MDNKNNKKSFNPINNQIRSQKIYCIDHENKNLGLIETYKALNIAQNVELDLVQVSYNSKENVPFCKILDYGRFKYDQSKKTKETAKKQREAEIKIKELKFRPNTDIADLKIKAIKAQEILDNGDKVRISIFLKGREVNFKDLAIEQYNLFISLLPNVEIIESPSFSGKTLTALGIKKSQ